MARIVARLVIASAIASLPAAALVGCATQRESAGADTRMSAADFRDSLSEMPAEIDRTLNSALKLTAGDNTNPAATLKQFDKDLDRMEDSASRLAYEADEATRNADSYFRAWNREISAKSTGGERLSEEAAMTARKGTYDRILGYLSDGKRDYRRLLGNLQDIQGKLTRDLSRGSIDSVRGAVQSSINDSVGVKQKISLITDELNKLLAGR